MEGFKEDFYFQVILCNCYTSVDIVSSHYTSDGTTYQKFLLVTLLEAIS